MSAPGQGYLLSMNFSSRLTPAVVACALTAFLVAVPPAARAQGGAKASTKPAPAAKPTAVAATKRLPLTAADIAEIVALEKLEDRRDFDAGALQRLAGAKHPELRRRAALAIARLYDPRGRALLKAMRADPDTSVLATVVWATGQLIDTSAVVWLDSLLQGAKTPVGVAVEAAGAFGKIRTNDTRLRLSLYLGNAAVGPKTAPVVAEALLSIGRHRDRGSIASIVRWAQSADVELRWRAAWALFRPRDPAAIPDLMALAKDPSPEVRFWAVRGLSGPRADSSDVGSAAARDALVAALGDADRRVQTEAVRSLGTFSDAGSMIQLTLLLNAEDMWIATTAAEGIGSRGDRARAAIAQLTSSTEPDNPAWIRAASLTSLANVWLAATVEPATAMAKDTSLTVRTAAAQVLSRLGVGGRAGLELLLKDADRGVRATAMTAYLALADTVEEMPTRRAARRAAFASPDVAVRAAAAASIAKWADASDIPTLLDAFAVALKDEAPTAQESVIETLADIEQRVGGAAAAFFAKYPAAPSDAVYNLAGRNFGPKVVAAWGNGRPVHATRSDADYQRIVESLLLPVYNGGAAPRLRWETTKGAVDTELDVLDTPLASDYLLQLVAKGTMQNIRFDRVVPNFVAQQREAEVAEPLQRDEISRGRLVRGNLSWGTNIGNAQRFPGRGPGAAYDTGPAVYTFGVTPQPHNEGDFSALGRVIKGMEIVDRLELGDYVKSVRVLKPGEK
jgi:HEAT repeat protein/cyclophilin family peptidyl-prolyl cis-trans isomerase